jgi:hypothetical protein
LPRFGNSSARARRRPSDPGQDFPELGVGLQVAAGLDDLVERKDAAEDRPSLSKPSTMKALAPRAL